MLGWRTSVKGSIDMFVTTDTLRCTFAHCTDTSFRYSSQTSLLVGFIDENLDLSGTLKVNWIPETKFLRLESD